MHTMIDETRRPKPHLLRTLAWLAWAAILSVALLGCKTQGDVRSGAAGSAKDDEDSTSLEARAKARWDHLILREAEQSWDYLSPGFRAITDREKYIDDMRNRPIRWLSAAVDRKECADEQTCDVVIRLDIEVVVPGAGAVVTATWVREKWLMIEGAWYHVP